MRNATNLVSLRGFDSSAPPALTSCLLCQQTTLSPCCRTTSPTSRAGEDVSYLDKSVHQKCTRHIFSANGSSATAKTQQSAYAHGHHYSSTEGADIFRFFLWTHETDNQPRLPCVYVPSYRLFNPPTQSTFFRLPNRGPVRLRLPTKQWSWQPAPGASRGSAADRFKNPPHTNRPRLHTNGLSGAGRRSLLLTTLDPAAPVAEQRTRGAGIHGGRHHVESGAKAGGGSGLVLQRPATAVAVAAASGAAIVTSADADAAAAILRGRAA
ncbi:unnamed protein product, partial [Ectocarpus sp. 12 AP-2014]